MFLPLNCFPPPLDILCFPYVLCLGGLDQWWLLRFLYWYDFCLDVKLEIKLKLFQTRVWTPLPLFLFSLMSTTFGLLALLFPETSNLPLPHTVEEAVNIRRTVIE